VLQPTARQPEVNKSLDPQFTPHNLSSMPDRYDTTQTWQWNLAHAPPLTPPAADVQVVPGDWNWCGLPVNSPLGIAAGPLLNGPWLRYYALRGFDILVYKTVRSSSRPCYSLPNLVPVVGDDLLSPGATVPAAPSMAGTWAVSFGMPSVAVAEWQADIAETRKTLNKGQLLVVSVVGTQATSEDGEQQLDALADDFASCAKLACEAGADGIEANFSCPNVSTDDGQLYQHPSSAALVAGRIRASIGDKPLVLKIGFTNSDELVRSLVQHVAPFVQGLAMTNAISARVKDRHGQLLFDGESRGICGDAIRQASIQQVRRFSDCIRRLGVPLQLVGVGGIASAEHVRSYLAAGATTVAAATAVMTNPELGIHIRRDLQSRR
jgi:dihydroorotate dehydrogenase (NAD+) catalytic subunit